MHGLVCKITMAMISRLCQIADDSINFNNLLTVNVVSGSLWSLLMLEAQSL